ncbi:MAG: hypothetical protein AYP45_09115 [Candidatus Brocadia carolinensis]|uniref:AMP-dependent synthetase/ligase domain-containing protein n=1 Tax=Candidatus Brocadia carolinensis TaxID=1004156 RepID=A0A1V4ATG7_9BACT|nr:MAG: hypothetical protein AYP45_09115 [Candidatus Brocadia caroliniensis]
MIQTGIKTNVNTTSINSDLLTKRDHARLDQRWKQPTLQDAEWFGVSIDMWVRHIISIHLDPFHGSLYWLQKEKMLGINARMDISSLDDLHILGPMEEEDLRKYPLEYFIPKIYLENKASFILGETAGTTGLPKTTAYLKEEFSLTFVEWFRYIAEYRGFPQGAQWLWVGPSGPHIIGKAVGPVAQSMGSMDPFSIDMDPRWVKKLKPDSLGFKRYISHILDQALDILNRQHIEVIYSTPPLLLRLAEMMPTEQRMQIRGIHYGGVAIEPEQLKQFRNELFPNAVHIAGYGNTLFGLCMEIEESIEGNLDYYPPGPRMAVQVVSTKDCTQPDKNRLAQVVQYGEKGQVVCHRLDISFFIPNMFERDEAIRIAPTKNVQALGIFQDGVRNPSLLKGLEANAKVGVY